MPLELMEKSVAFIATASRMIVSGLGEPTLAPAFWWLLDRLADRHDVFVRVNSNGHFINTERARKILNSGLSEISFSLDAASSGTYSRIRGGDFEHAISGISTLLELRKTAPANRTEIFINMTLMRENLQEAEAFVSLGKGLGADGIIFSQLFEFGNRPDWRVDREGWTFSYADQMLAGAPMEASRHISQAKRHAEELDMLVHYQSNVLGYVNEPAAP
jgi:MoaA/NifB/PqqE/SkfB family radical SAM enzyme